MPNKGDILWMFVGIRGKSFMNIYNVVSVEVSKYFDSYCVKVQPIIETYRHYTYFVFSINDNFNNMIKKTPDVSFTTNEEVALKFIEQHT